MSSASMIRNLGHEPVCLPPPFKGCLMPLVGTIVTGSKSTIEDLLGGSDAIAGALEVIAVADDSPAGDNDIADLDMGAKKIVDVADPTAAQHAATKAYVDARNVTTVLDDLASHAHGAGASLVAIEDALGLITATDTEGALAELAKYQPITLADPGTGQAIPVTRSASVDMTIGSAGAETNTLAIPSFVGQRMHIIAGVVGTGTRAITAASAINQAGNTIMTFAQVKDFIALVAMKMGGVLVWRVASNDGVALS